MESILRLSRTKIWEILFTFQLILSYRLQRTCSLGLQVEHQNCFWVCLDGHGCTAGTGGQLESTTHSNVWSQILVCWPTAISKKKVTQTSGWTYPWNSTVIKNITTDHSWGHHGPQHLGKIQWDNCSMDTCTSLWGKWTDRSTSRGSNDVRATRVNATLPFLRVRSAEEKDISELDPTNWTIPRCLTLCGGTSSLSSWSGWIKGIFVQPLKVWLATLVSIIFLLWWRLEVY